MRNSSTKPSRSEGGRCSQERDAGEDVRKPTKPPLSDEAVENIVEFILCVREILENLQARGYNIQTGELVRPGHDNEPRS